MTFYTRSFTTMSTYLKKLLLSFPFLFVLYWFTGTSIYETYAKSIDTKNENNFPNINENSFPVTNEKSLTDKNMTSFPTKIVKSFPTKISSDYRSISEKCYDYDNLQAVNHCCRMLDYTEQNKSYIHQCAQNHFREISGSDIIPPSGFLPREGGSNGTHWVFFGNSRVRRLFFTLVKIYKIPGAQYHKTTFYGTWHTLSELVKWMPVVQVPVHEDMRVGHPDMPLHLTFYWDTHMKRFPEIVGSWLNDTSKMPARIHFGFGLHYMRDDAKNQDVALSKYKNQIAILLPVLQEVIKKNIPVSCGIEERPNIAKVWDNLKVAWGNTNVDRFNSYLRSQVEPIGVHVLDSHLPLADLFSKECNRKEAIRKGAPEDWSCADPVHHGYLPYRQYANMLLNSYCNEYLTLNDSYC